MARNPLFRRKSVSHILSEVASGYGDGEARAGLRRSLTLRDLTLMGFAAIIGAGLFSTIGKAASDGGPAISMLFVFVALACGFAALCYAEFASAIPISGSAYTYAYASFGELAAWIIGWDLIIEYAIGNIVVAISWSDYFTSFLGLLHIHIPLWLETDYVTASHGHSKVLEMLASAPAEAVAAFKANPTVEALQALVPDPSSVSRGLVNAFSAFEHAPALFGLPLVFDLPALFIIVLITYIIYRGIRESKATSNWLVYIKMGVIALVLGIGAAYVDVENWQPFTPHGFEGVMKGVAGVFFAYIGFDALSTMSEESKNPQRDLPRAMLLALVICTVLYVLIALILTGVVPYNELNASDPMAVLIQFTDLSPWWKGAIGLIVGIGAIIATTSVLLVFQMGQPRILMSMSRDGLLPKRFSRIHPKYLTPGFASIVTGFGVAVPALFMNFDEVTKLSSIGTLFAFVLVCGGILYMQLKPNADYKPTFKVFYINAQVWLPVLYVATWVGLVLYNLGGLAKFASFSDAEHGTFWSIVSRMPMLVFVVAATVLTVYALRRKFSLIPALGMLTCLYLMAEVDVMSWIRFGAWLGIGLLIYFLYSRHNSRLGKVQRGQNVSTDDPNVVV